MNAAGTARGLLAPLSWLYGAAVAVRNACYDRGILGSTPVGTPVISVGNIAAGGTGKTPVVEAVVGVLLGAGLKPAVLSRGYRRTTRGTLAVSDGTTLLADADASGDEPAQIARKFRGCAVAVDEDRVRGAKFLEARYRPDAIVLDDGFQHRSLARDLDIVVLSGRTPALLPAGNGREPERSLRRAGLIVLNGDGTVLPRAAAATPHVRMRYDVTRFVRRAVASGDGTEIDATEVARGGFVAFCGIGNPGAFRSTLAGRGLAPAAFIAFPDHRRYDAADLGAIASAARRAGAAYVLTTEKDAARLTGPAVPAAPFAESLVVVGVRAAIAGGPPSFEAMVLGTARRRAALKEGS